MVSSEAGFSSPPSATIVGMEIVPESGVSGLVEVGVLVESGDDIDMSDGIGKVLLLDGCCLDEHRDVDSKSVEGHDRIVPSDGMELGDVRSPLPAKSDGSLGLLSLSPRCNSESSWSTTSFFTVCSLGAGASSEKAKELALAGRKPLIVSGFVLAVHSDVLRFLGPEKYLESNGTPSITEGPSPGSTFASPDCPVKFEFLTCC
jgi:hypothetical protein